MYLPIIYYQLHTVYYDLYSIITSNHLFVFSTTTTFFGHTALKIIWGSYYLPLLSGRTYTNVCIYQQCKPHVCIQHYYNILWTHCPKDRRQVWGSYYLRLLSGHKCMHLPILLLSLCALHVLCPILNYQHKPHVCIQRYYNIHTALQISYYCMFFKFAFCYLRWKNVPSNS